MPWIAPAIGAGAVLFGSSQQAGATRDAANAAAQAAQFDPYNVYAQGIGGAEFGGPGLYDFNQPVQGQPVQGGGGGGLFGTVGQALLGAGGGGDAQGSRIPWEQLPQGQRNALIDQYRDSPDFMGAGFSPSAAQAYGSGTLGGVTSRVTGGLQDSVGGAGGGDNLNIRLDPQMEAFRQQFLQGAGKQSPLFGQAGGLFGQAGQNMFNQGFQNQGIGQGVTGLGQDVTGFGAGAFGQSQGLFQQGLGQLGAASNLDPNQIAQNQFDITSRMLEPGQAQARTSLENRLFAQGRLGGTGGSEQFGNLLQAQGQERNQLRGQALGQGLQAQGQLFNQGLGTLGASRGQAGIGQSFLGLGTQQIGQGVGISQSGAGQLGQGAGLFGQQIGLEDQALQRQLNQINASRTLAQDPLQLANLGIGIGGRQAAAGASVAPLLFQAGQANPGASALMGFGSSIAQNPGLFNFGGGGGANPYTASPVNNVFGAVPGAEGTGFGTY